MSAPERIWAWPWEVNPRMGQWEAERSIAGDGWPYVPEAALTAAQAEIARLTAELEREEKSHAETIGQRDRTEAMADELARAIGGDAVGEHSNINCPWTNAMEIARKMNGEIARLTNAVKFREDMHECAMAERDDCIKDWSEAKSEIARLTAERDAAMAGRVKVKLTRRELQVLRLILHDHITSEVDSNGQGQAMAERILGKVGLTLAALQPDTERAEPVAWGTCGSVMQGEADSSAPFWLHDQPVTLTYTNWRGETAQRTIIPRRVWFGSTDWHPEPQWLLTALDVEKQADRDFALKDFGAPAPQAEPVARPAGWFCFDASTGEYTAEWCSVKPHDATGFVPLYSAPQAREITVQEAARVLLSSLQSRPQTGISHMWAEAYGAMKHPKTSWDDFAAALRAIADMQKGG